MNDNQSALNKPKCFRILGLIFELNDERDQEKNRYTDNKLSIGKKGGLETRGECYEIQLKKDETKTV